MRRQIWVLRFLAFVAAVLLTIRITKSEVHISNMFANIFAQGLAWFNSHPLLVRLCDHVLYAIQMILGLVLFWHSPWGEWLRGVSEGEQFDFHRRGRRVHTFEAAEQRAYQELLRRRSAKRAPRSRSS